MPALSAIGRGMSGRHPMETGTTKRDQSVPARTSNLFHQILSPKALIVGAVLATVWIYFLGFQTVRLIEAALQ
jgi:hypothetical protein